MRTIAVVLCLFWRNDKTLNPIAMKHKCVGSQLHWRNQVLDRFYLRVRTTLIILTNDLIIIYLCACMWYALQWSLSKHVHQFYVILVNNYYNGYQIKSIQTKLRREGVGVKRDSRQSNRRDSIFGSVQPNAVWSSAIKMKPIEWRQNRIICVSAFDDVRLLLWMKWFAIAKKFANSNTKTLRIECYDRARTRVSRLISLRQKCGS